MTRRRKNSSLSHLSGLPSAGWKGPSLQPSPQTLKLRRHLLATGSTAPTPPVPRAVRGPRWRQFPTLGILESPEMTPPPRIRASNCLPEPVLQDFNLAFKIKGTKKKKASFLLVILAEKLPRHRKQSKSTKVNHRKTIIT